MGEEKIVIENLELGTNHESSAVVINCVDPRLPRALGGAYEFMIKKGFMPMAEDGNPRSAESIVYFMEHIDYFTFVGGGRVLTKTGHELETALIDIRAGKAFHKAPRIIVISHSECGASIHNGEEPKDGDWKTMKCAELEEALKVAKQFGIPVHILYVEHKTRRMSEV